jgi:hypothetical protein
MNIIVDHTDNAISAQSIGPTYDMDKGPLFIPDHIKIGAKGHDGSKISSYADQVNEYDVWLEDQIKAQNLAVCCELETIYQKATQMGGIILSTRCCPAPYITHAHVVKRAIEELAKGAS